MHGKREPRAHCTRGLDDGAALSRPTFTTRSPLSQIMKTFCKQGQAWCAPLWAGHAKGRVPGHVLAGCTNWPISRWQAAGLGVAGSPCLRFDVPVPHMHGVEVLDCHLREGQAGWGRRSWPGARQNI